MSSAPATFHRKDHPTALPTLYTDIISTILSFIDVSEEPEALWNAALVCKEWCQLSRPITFAKLDDLSPDGLANFREVLIPSSSHHVRGKGQIPVQNTFAKHVRKATLYVHLLRDTAWADTIEMITLIDRFFTVKFSLTIILRSGILKATQLRDINTRCGGKITHIGLICVQLDMPRDELSHILCDESWPSLKNMTMERTGWDAKSPPDSHSSAPPLYTVDKGTFRPKAGTTLTLDHLHFLEDQCDFDVKFWLHQTFDTLIVKALTIRVDTLGYTFWQGVPDMFNKISANLVELDVAHELNYAYFTQAVKWVKFPQLQTLKLRIMQGSGYSLGRSLPLGDTESALHTLLQQMHLPALEKIVICLADAKDYIQPDASEANQEPTYRTRRLFVHPLKWDIIDDAVSQLARQAANRDSGAVTGRSSRLSKVVIGAWYEEWSGEKDEGESLVPILLYLRERLPECVSSGLHVDFEILSYEYA